MLHGRIHFIGIGGVGVNALARYATDCGVSVSGSDAKLNPLCASLIDSGADIYEGVNPAKVEGADLVVYTSAIKGSHPELSHARELGIATLERHEFLGEIASEFETVVGIAGTHGKTTTTAMLAHILSVCDREFVGMIGGESVEFGNYVNNSRGRHGLFVAEACEYKRNFLALHPTVAAVTNIECDHPDCYCDIDDVRAAFNEYMSEAKIRVCSIEADGDFSILIENGKNVSECRIINTDGKYGYFADGSYMGDIELSEGGDYNIKNAAFAVAVASVLGINSERALFALSTFVGVKRRFEYGGSIDGVPVYFDFAHHPTEIGCVIQRASEYGRILAVFQPHTYSRTKAYFDDFVRVLGDSPYVGALVLMPTYAARELPTDGCDAEELANAIMTRCRDTDVHMAKNAEDAISIVKNLAKYHDAVLFIGAGDIYDIKNML